MSIKIKKSPTADTRTCNWSEVTRDQLFDSSYMHKNDVLAGMLFFSKMILEAGRSHDDHKIKTIDHFHQCFLTGFTDNSWWKEHQKERHHVQENNNPDVNLIDVLEMITDCVMAGKARSGKVRDVTLPIEKLQLAFDNTVKLLESQVEVIDELDIG